MNLSLRHSDNPTTMHLLTLRGKDTGFGWLLFQQDEVLIGSDCMTLILILRVFSSAHWVLSECSLNVLRLLSDCSYFSLTWPRKMKIYCWLYNHLGHPHCPEASSKTSEYGWHLLRVPRPLQQSTKEWQSSGYLNWPVLASHTELYLYTHC